MNQKSITNAPAEGANSMTTAQTEQPIDHEALPFPSKNAPELIKTLVKQLPPMGIIHPSVLAAFGEILTFAGALMGLDYKYTHPQK